MSQPPADSPRRSDLPELLIRIRQGDASARREAIDLLADEAALGATLLRITRKMLPQDHPARNVLDSREAVQSALTTALAKFSAFRGDTEGNLYGWLSQIIRTKISIATKRAGRTLPEAPAAEEPDPIQSLVIEELLDELHAAIGELDLDKRIVIELRLREFNSNQIAKILGLKPPAARQRESRAIQDLRTFMNVRKDADDARSG